jgi:hypothetical protein
MEPGLYSLEGPQEVRLSAPEIKPFQAVKDLLYADAYGRTAAYGSHLQIDRD